MDDNELFIADAVDEITKRRNEAHQEMLDDPDDLFKSGRALGLEEAYEMLLTRLEVYGIKIS